MSIYNTADADTLGYKRGLESAIRAIKVEQKGAADSASYHYEQIRKGTLEGEAYNYHRARYEFYNGKSDALMDTIRGLKQQLKQF